MIHYFTSIPIFFGSATNGSFFVLLVPWLHAILLPPFPPPTRVCVLPPSPFPLLPPQGPGGDALHGHTPPRRSPPHGPRPRRRTGRLFCGYASTRCHCCTSSLLFYQYIYSLQIPQSIVRTPFPPYFMLPGVCPQGGDFLPFKL